MYLCDHDFFGVFALLGLFGLINMFGLIGMFGLFAVDLCLRAAWCVCFRRCVVHSNDVCDLSGWFPFS